VNTIKTQQNMESTHPSTTATTNRSIKKRPATEYMGLFDINELTLGKHLGSGGYADVYEIKGFRLNEDRQEHMTSTQNTARDFLKQHVARRRLIGKKQPRYAVKFLQEKLVHNDKGFKIAAMDLASEQTILTDIEHPNILKIRGWGADGIHGYQKQLRHDGYFLILDCLKESLEERIRTWKKYDRQLTDPSWLQSILTDEAKRDLKRRDFLAQKLQVGHDICCALEYLHEKGLIYRDLKPANVGFDVRNDVKIFDFGLARALPKEGGIPDPNSGNETSFDMSGGVGTLRYMAPEVCQKQRYNTKADVYSFAHLLWEMLALEKPYEYYTRQIHRTRVVEMGERPRIQGSWPSGVRDLIRNAWDADMSKRPTIQECRKILAREIGDLRGEQAPARAPAAARHARRRSTFVLELPPVDEDQ